ncbi:MAG: MogA/MoaB family molybdenum cofactor biosynthesis protein [Candidatus Bathyarchaeia archaeon]|nr:molybdenum cofactor biosynthesis protein MoaB [Candidatus Bathyarchaeota archaeon A05DMB-4]MDH7596098.1 molybdenum cofactor biosynthesis protein B [Candidatus Bathyarchaeota archaeon]
MSETSRKHKAEAPKTLGFAVITVSSSRFKAQKSASKVEDPSGDLTAQLVEKAGHKVVLRSLVPDDRILIGKSVSESLGRHDVDVVVTCGGTGIALSDVTIETIRPLLVKTLPGFGEIFRRLSFDEIGSAAIMSRALAGVSDGGKAVFCLPGSPNAVRLCVERLILPEAGHIVKHAREG